MQQQTKRYPQREFERDAIGGLASYFRSLGLSVTERGHPEDDLENPINVDAIFLIDSKPWAIEHSRIVYDHQGPAAEQAAENYLRPRLDELTKIHQVRLRVSFYAPRWNGKKPPKDEWNAIVKLAGEAIASERLKGDERGNSVVAIPGTPLVDFNFIRSDNASLGSQYDKALRASLISKLSGQLKSAKNHGYSVLLLLDQRPAPLADPGTMWMRDAGTLDNEVERIVKERPGIVDEVWLREASACYRRVIGNSLELNISGNPGCSS